MKKFLMYFLLSVVLLISGLEAKAANYYSVAGGSWNSPSTWSATSGGSPGTTIPAAGDDVYIEGGYLISLDLASTAALHSLSIASGSTYQTHAAYATTATIITVYGTLNNSGGGANINGSITVNSGGSFIAAGAGAINGSMTVNSGGTFTNSGAGVINGSMTVNSDGIYQHNLNGGTIPTATWSANSNCIIQGITSTGPSGLNQSFGNFEWNCTSQSGTINLGGQPANIQGTFTLRSTGGGLIAQGADLTFPYYVQTGGTFQLTSGNIRKLTIDHDFSISGGIFYVTLGSAAGTLNITGNFSSTGGTFNMSSGSGIGTLNVGDNFTHTSGTITETSTGSGAIVFNGSGIQTYTSGGTVSNTINFTVNSGAYLQMAAEGTIVSGGGTFTLSYGGTLGITSAAGITSSGASGNIQVTGSRTYSTGANYIYNGSGAQATGSGLPTAAITGNVTIASGASVTTTNSLIENGTLSVNGTLIPGSASQTISGSGGLTGTGTVQVNRTASTPDFLSQYTISNRTLTSLTVEYTVPGGSQVVSALTYNNLKLDNTSGTNTLGGTVTVNGTLTTTGGGTLTVGASQLLTATTLTNAGIFTIDPSGQATVTSMANSGTLNLNSTASSAIFSLMMNNYSGSGTTNAQLYLTGGGNPNYNWHYVAVPFVAGLSKTVFTDVDVHNLLAYDNSRVSTSEFQGWLWNNGEAHGGLTAGTPFSTLLYGIGYNFYHTSDYTTITLTGTTLLGTTLGNVGPLQYLGSGDNTIRGYNLLGNSLTCSLNWDNVTFAGSVEQTVHYTIGNKWAEYNPTLHEGTNGGTKDIPPLQGFFVKANATGASIDLSNAKEHSSQARYKGSSQAEAKEEIIYPEVKLELSSTGTSDETIVWFNDEATTGYDENYDGYKLFSSEASFGQLYSILGGMNYAIDGIPLPADSIIVPLGLKIAQAGSYSILKKVLVEPSGYNIFLVDKANGNYTVDLKKAGSYAFSSDAGTFTDRFILKFVSLTVSIENPKADNKIFNIYGTKGVINILPSDDFKSVSNGIVKIYDLSGRVVRQSNNTGLYPGTLVQIPFNGQKGIYIVEITSSLSRYKGKVLMW